MGARREMAAAAAALERLEALSCPALAPLAPLAPAEALRLLCAPSAPRLELLEWLCSRVYPPLATRLDTLRDGPEDARLRELARLGAQLLLCRPDDLALMEGTAPPEQQLGFIWDLLDAAPPSPPHGGSPRSSPGVLLQGVELLHEVLETPEGEGALDPPCPPPALSLRTPRSRSPPGRGAQREAALGRLRRRLEQLEAEEAALGGAVGPGPPPLWVGGRDLAALAAAFGETELGGGPGGAPTPPPKPAPCGALAPPVRRGLRALRQSLGVLSQLRDTAAEVTRLEGGQRAMETPVAALWQRFGPPPKPGGAPQD